MFSTLQDRRSHLGVAQKTVERMMAKVLRLYEQGADQVRIEAYLRRWWQWVRSGVNGFLKRVDWLVCRCFGALHFFNASFLISDRTVIYLFLTSTIRLSLGHRFRIRRLHLASVFS